MKWLRWIVCMIGVVLVNELVGLLLGIKLGPVLVVAIVSGLAKLWREKDELAEATYSELKSRIPPAVRDKCETLRGNSRQLRSYLEECASQKLIDAVCIPVLMKEFAPDYMKELRYSEIRNAVPGSVADRCREFSGDRSRMEGYLNRCVEAKLIPEEYVYALLEEFAPAQASGAGQYTAPETKQQNGSGYVKNNTIPWEREEGAASGVRDYVHRSRSDVGLAVCPQCGRQQSSLHVRCAVCNAEMSGAQAFRQQPEQMLGRELPLNEDGLTYYLFCRKDGGMKQYDYLRGSRRIGGAQAQDVPNSVLSVRGSNVSVNCRRDRAASAASGTGRSFTVQGSTREYARLTCLGYGKHILNAGSNEIHIIPENGGFQFYLKGVSIARLYRESGNFRSSGGGEYRFTLKTSQQLPEQVVLLMMSFPMCRME